MADFSQSNTPITDAILGRSAPQQFTVRQTAPPLSGPGSGVVPVNVPGTIEGKPIGPYLPDGGVCIEPPPDSWDFQWITLEYTGTIPQAMLSDFYVQLRKPVRKLFMVGNNSPGGQALFIHFNPLKKYNGVVISNIDGNEPWIPFPGCTNLHGVTGGTGTGLTDASYIKFCKPISKFYATIYNGSGSGPWRINLLATDDVDMEFSNAV